MPALEPYLIEPVRQRFTIEGGYGDDRLVGGRGYDDEIEGGYGDDRTEAADGVYDSVGCGPGYAPATTTPALTRTTTLTAARSLTASP